MEVSVQFVVIIGAYLFIIVMGIVLFVIQRSRCNRLEAAIAQLKRQIAPISDEQKDVLHKIEEAQARTIAVARSVAQGQEKVEAVENQMRELQQQDPNMRLYHRAAAMVKAGASLEEVMSACDIPLAEAQLLMNLHKR